MSILNCKQIIFFCRDLLPILNVLEFPILGLCITKSLAKSFLFIYSTYNVFMN